MFEEHVKKIEEWMESHYTDPDLVDLVVYYLRGRGKRKFGEFTKMSARQYRVLGQAQDRIGWRHFTEGKLTKEFRAIQKRFHCVCRAPGAVERKRPATPPNSCTLFPQIPYAFVQKTLQSGYENYTRANSPVDVRRATL